MVSPRTPGPRTEADQPTRRIAAVPAPRSAADPIRTVPAPRAPSPSATAVIPEHQTGRRTLAMRRGRSRGRPPRHAGAGRGLRRPRLRSWGPVWGPVVGVAAGVLGIVLLAWLAVRAFDGPAPVAGARTSAPAAHVDPATGPVPGGPPPVGAGPAPVVAPAPVPSRPTATPSGRSVSSARGTPPLELLVTPGARASGGGELLSLPGGTRFQVYGSHPMSGSAKVTRALVVVHGTGRNAEGYFERAMQAARAAGADGRTMVLAPWFKAEDDEAGAGEPKWTNDDWKQGYAARRPGGLSSFTVMDSLVASLADPRRFPNLTHITVAGHSAGGQFAQRYAAFGRAPDQVPGVGVNYVVMNSSSYLYFDDRRPTGNGAAFAVPSAADCPGYADYKYGLRGRQGYPARLTAAQAEARYAGRRVTVVNGAADTVDNGNLDTDCSAMLQGPNREARGRYFVAHFRAGHPGAVHDRLVVPGVDHDSEQMLASPVVRRVLFGSR